jgi:lipid A 3-O-deacylase
VRARAFIATALTLLATPAHAGPSGAQFLVDNDYLNFWVPPEERDDVGYTNGFEMQLVFEGSPGWLAALAPKRLEGSEGDFPARTVASLRQEIYVPWTLTGDRPFAGWLEIGLGLRRETEDRLREGRLRIGVTGPPSLAEDTYNWFHETFGFEPRTGWEDQLPAEPGFRIDYEEVGRWNSGSAERVRMDIGPRWRARLGTMNTDFRVGADVVAGVDPPPVWGGDRSAAGWSLYGTGAVRLDVVLRDGFIEGTFFKPSAGIDWIVMVPEIQGGLGVRYQHARFEWRVQRRGREFPDQPEPHTYSSLIFTWTPGPAPR